jgi:hypothetical protein
LYKSGFPTLATHVKEEARAYTRAQCREQCGVIGPDECCPEGLAVSAPPMIGATAARPSRSPGSACSVPRVRANQRGDPLLWEIAPVLGEIAARYPDVSDQMIRQQAIEVLSAAHGNRVSAALVARLVEARVIALM